MANLSSKWLCFILWLLCAATVYAQPPAGRIYDTAAQSNISPDALAQALSQAQTVIIGEKHDESSHHQAKLWLLQNTETARAAGTVLLEMLDTSQQAQVSEVQTWLLVGGQTPDRRLADKMAWNHAWPWSDYQALVSRLMRHPATVLAALPERQQIKQQSVGFMPAGRLSSAPAVRQALAQIMGGQHGSATAAARVATQQYKDDFMAKRLSEAAKPAWLLTGSIHASKQLGVPLFLTDAGKTQGLKVLIMTEPDSDIDPRHADYIWYLEPTP